MFAPLHQPPSRHLNLADCVIEVGLVDEPEADVVNATRADARVIWLLIQSDGVLCARRVQEDHVRPVSELFLHSEDVLVEAQRPCEVGDKEVDVCETFGTDHMRNIPLLVVRSLGDLVGRPRYRYYAVATIACAYRVL